jgi:hypothetical protein
MLLLVQAVPAGASSSSASFASRYEREPQAFSHSGDSQQFPFLTIPLKHLLQEPLALKKIATRMSPQGDLFPAIFLPA